MAYLLPAISAINAINEMSGGQLSSEGTGWLNDIMENSSITAATAPEGSHELINSYFNPNGTYNGGPTLYQLQQGNVDQYGNYTTINTAGMTAEQIAQYTPDPNIPDNVAQAVQQGADIVNGGEATNGTNGIGLQQAQQGLQQAQQGAMQSYCNKPPSDCFDKCELMSKAKFKLCNVVNSAFLKEMKNFGCKGTKCSLKNDVKTCSAKKRKTKKKRGPKPTCTKKRTSKTRCDGGLCPFR